MRKQLKDNSIDSANIQISPVLTCWKSWERSSLTKIQPSMTMGPPSFSLVNTTTGYSISCLTLAVMWAEVVVPHGRMTMFCCKI